MFRTRISNGRRHKTPTVLQMEAVECGAASLCMVLGYYGRFIALEDARIACGVSRDGSKASNIVRAARRYGLESQGVRTEPDGLEALGFPSILHWNLNHFVVLEGIRGDYVFLNDPALGPRRVSRDELDCAFSGIVLTFRPAPDFVPGGRRFGVMAPLARRLRNSLLPLAFVAIAAMLLLGPGLIAPAFSKVFVDEVLIGGATSWLRPLVIAMVMAALVTASLTLLQREFLLRFETQLAASGAAQFFWHVLRLPIAFFTQRYGGEVGARVGMNDRIAAILSGELAVSVVGALTVVVYAVAMARYDVGLAAIGVMAAVLNVGFLWWVGAERRDATQRLVQERGKLMGVAMGAMQTIETLKAGGYESDYFSRWAGHQAKMLNAQQHLGVRTQLLTVVPPALAAVSVALVLGLGGSRVIDGAMTMGALVAFQGLLAGFLAPVGRCVALGGTLQESYADLKRLEDVLQAAPDEGAPAARLTAAGSSLLGKPSRARLSGAIEARDVTFGFSPLDPPLIDRLTLNVRPGETIALVGGSGSGKSTLARLLCGLYQPWSGEIRFDGKTRLDHDPRVLAASLAYVDQEVFLFEGSIHDNITLWDETVPEQVVIRAAKDAALHDVIVTRPGAYRASVGEGGRNFSGGQRQRMEIARALALRPSILVLDEATSALDAETERRVSESIRRRGCTCVIVAHRLSAVRDADRILVMDRGAVVEEGDHDSLVSAGGIYQRLMESQ